MRWTCAGAGSDPGGDRPDRHRRLRQSGFRRRGFVWVPVTAGSATAERVTVLRIDPVSGAVARRSYAGSSEVRIRLGGGAVWLADPADARAHAHRDRDGASHRHAAAWRAPRSV